MRRIKTNGQAEAAVSACLLVFVCLTSMSAQTTTTFVTGRITDARGAGLPGANVTLYPRERPSERLETVTDEDGQYLFERVAPGTYLIEAKGTGFARSAALPLRVGSGANPPLDISLELAGIREEVVVTASGSAQTVDEVSKAITVIDQRELDERDEYAIAPALQTVPALRVAQLGGPGAAVEIRARGLRPQDTAVLVDGLRLRDAAAEQGSAQTLLGSLLLTDVSRVEVLRGSGSSLYGSNAVGAAVNLVSNEGGGPLHGNVLLEGGSLQFFRGRFKMAGGLGEGNRLVYSLGFTHVNVLEGIDGDDASRITAGQWHFTFHFTPRTTLSARLYAADAYAQLNNIPALIFPNSHPEEIIEAVPLAPSEIRRYRAWPLEVPFNFGAATFIPDLNDPDEARKTRFFHGAFVLTGQPSETLSYTLSYQALPTRRTFTDGPGGSLHNPFSEPYYNSREDDDGHIHTFNGRADFRLGRANFITAGYEFEHEQYIKRNYDLFAFSTFENDAELDVVQRSHALFAQDQMSFLNSRLRVSAAFRAQFFALGHVRFRPLRPPYPSLSQAPPGAYTGDASAAYFFNRTQTKLRAHVGNGQRSPSLFERYHAFYGAFCVGFSCFAEWEPEGYPLVRSERSISFDAGVDQSLFGNRLRATATYFYTSVRRAIELGFFSPYDPAPSPFETPVYNCFVCYLNKRGGQARGLELSATAAPTRSLDIFASYTYTNSDKRVEFFEFLRPATIPYHQFSLVASQRLGRHVLLSSDVVAFSDYTTQMSFFLGHRFHFRGSVKADLAASYTQPLSETKSVRYFGKVENLFDREYFERGYRTPGRTITVGMAFSF